MRWVCERHKMSDAPRKKLTAVEGYRRLWRGEDKPSLRDYLAKLPVVGPDDLVDLIEVDRAERWRRGDRVDAEKYLNDFPSLRRDVESALVVIYGEFYMRRELGESPSLSHFVERFPDYSDRLRDQVMWHEAISDVSPAITKGPPTIAGITVGELLGRGGMASVYRATDDATGQTIAVKVLASEHARQPVRAARFRREVSALLRLHHPNIVTAMSTGEADGRPYIVMELCAGGSLAALMNGKPLAWKSAVFALCDLAGAIEYAHNQGVIHRDLKPGNVLLNPVKVPGATGFPFIPKVSDFGLAKCLIGMEPGLTATRESLGTPAYMSPELTTGARSADPRADVYGLGAILYEMLTGRPPFVAPSAVEVVRKVRDDLPVPPDEINSRVPTAVASVCLKCLEKDPNDRYQSAGELLRALEVMSAIG